MLAHEYKVISDKVKETEEEIFSDFTYTTTKISKKGSNGVTVTPITQDYQFCVKKQVPRTGVMIVGIGGNNGTTFISGIIANRENISYKTKTGEHKPTYFGSLTQSTSIHLGDDTYIPFNAILPMLNPNELVFGGWDISGLDLAAAAERAQVLEPDLQNKLRPYLEKIKPLPSIYLPDFIAPGQKGRADHVLEGSKKELLDQIRKNMREFKAQNKCDKVIVIWSASTERFSKIQTNINDTAENLLDAINRNEEEISPSTLFAVASILEGHPYINGSPQNTFVPGVIELAEKHGITIGGDDFKTGQTKMKSMLADFLVSSGFKPTAIVSYNHLGNNDGANLAAAPQVLSKITSKTNVIDSIIESNPILFAPGESPDHLVVIKYIPSAGDTKRSMDEYVSEIFMGGENDISIFNLCEDSLLAAPVMLDLVILTELLDRITWRTASMKKFERFHPVASILSFLLKAPLVPTNTPVINALSKQRNCIENILRACSGLPTENHMLLENKCMTIGKRKGSHA